MVTLVIFYVHVKNQIIMILICETTNTILLVFEYVIRAETWKRLG
jgi:hypothetical protein